MYVLDTRRESIYFCPNRAYRWCKATNKTRNEKKIKNKKEPTGSTRKCETPKGIARGRQKNTKTVKPCTGWNPSEIYSRSCKPWFLRR